MPTMTDLDDIRERTVSATEYVESMDGKEGDMFREAYRQYRLDPATVEELRPLADDIVVVVISAKWCKDCRNAVPVLRHLEETLGIEVRVFGNVKTAPLDPDHQWKVPPSPPEMEDWGVTRIPWIVLFDRQGNRLGTIVERPAVMPTLEAEILHLLKG